ncbi:MAG TPA: hypothetical protein VKQ36_09525 [Ktedonobacterales bacterium]|nr:hypothetical protein [Ktedonobacterales bacterium]
MSSPTSPAPVEPSASTTHTAPQPPARISAGSASTGGSDLSREIQALMAARREMGPDYDEHFADVLAERLSAQVQREVTRQIGSSKNRSMQQRGFSPEQRLGLAITSIIFLIPLVAIAGGMQGLTGIFLVCGLVLLINLLARFF